MLDRSYTRAQTVTVTAVTFALNFGRIETIRMYEVIIFYYI